jgi:predicted nucleotide-binding protein (sugar kinase/HSP70/actin superfamily)
MGCRSLGCAVTTAKSSSNILERNRRTAEHDSCLGAVIVVVRLRDLINEQQIDEDVVSGDALAPFVPL